MGLDQNQVGKLQSRHSARRCAGGQGMEYKPAMAPGHRLVNPLQLIEGDCHVVLAQAENAAHT